MKNKRSVTTFIVLVIGILILLNVLSNKFFLRFDFTQDNRYTLSQATKDILSDLSETVTVTAYFTKDLPPDIAKTRQDFKELLIEYVNLSKGNIVYEFIDPSGDDETERKAMQNGVQPVLINAMEKDQTVQKKAYLGVVVQMGEEKDIIPFMQPGAAMEYALSSSIKKISALDKPVIGLLQGHGEPEIGAFQQVMSQLAILYTVEPVTLTDTTQSLSKYSTVALVRPTDSFSFSQLTQLDNFLAKGGNLFIAYNRVEGELQSNPPMGKSSSTGIEAWLANKGLSVDNNFVIDANCANVGVQQQQGNFNYTTNVGFPYIPIISAFEEHPITKGLEAIILPFVSSITYFGDTSLTFVPLAKTSDKSGTQQPPLYFDISRQWADHDFPLSGLIVAGVLSGKIVGNTESKIILVSDGDFPVNGSGREAMQLQPDNVSLMVNSIDWLSDATGLIGLRTKGITARPLDQIDDSKRTFLKYLNFLLPVVLVIIYGIIRMQRNRNIKIKRMEEGYV